MDFSLIYLVHRFFYRFFDFFHHWYVDGSRWFGRKFMGTFRLVIGLMIYLVASIIMLLFYIVWLGIPAVVLYAIVSGNGKFRLHQ